MGKTYIINKKIEQLEGKITNLELLFKSPSDMLYKLQEINYEIKRIDGEILNQEELIQLKLTAMDDKINQIAIWGAGLLITIIGSIIGFAISAFNKS